ncbi:MAG: hypothetical protein ABWZ66_08710 [Pyrinomonadaceae bacterium]
MKKFTTTFVLLFVLSISTFAEGEYPLGGKSCPQGTTCRPAETVENPVLVDIFDFLKSIFG